MDGIPIPITIHHVFLNPNPIHAKFKYMLNIVIGILFDETGLKCNTCEERFTLFSKLCMHTLIHTKVKQYKCCFGEKKHSGILKLWLNLPRLKHS